MSVTRNRKLALNLQPVTTIAAASIETYFPCSALSLGTASSRLVLYSELISDMLY